MPHTSRGFHREGAAGALTPNGDPVLSARFIVPVVPRTFISRPRLTERFTRALEGPLVLVNGPAGAGKTLLVDVSSERIQGTLVAVAPVVDSARVVPAARSIGEAFGLPLRDEGGEEGAVT